MRIQIKINCNIVLRKTQVVHQTCRYVFKEHEKALMVYLVRRGKLRSHVFSSLLLAEMIVNTKQFTMSFY